MSAEESKLEMANIEGAKGGRGSWSRVFAPVAGSVARLWWIRIGTAGSGYAAAVAAP